MKRLFEGLFLLLLIAGGFLWYNSSYKITPNAALSALSESSSQQYSDYVLEFSYPVGWQVEKMNISGNEVLHHVNYYDPAGSAHGFIQVWAASKPLKQFLNESLHSPASSSKLQNFSMMPSRVGDKEGYLIAYERESKDRVMVAREFFFTKYKRVYRVSLFVPKENWVSEKENVLKEMTASLKLKY